MQNAAVVWLMRTNEECGIFWFASSLTNWAAGAICRVLQKVKDTYGLPVITDIHDASQAARVAEVADILQIPAFLCRQTDLILAAAKTGKVLQIKKGQFCGPSVMRNSADKARSAGRTHNHCSLA